MKKRTADYYLAGSSFLKIDVHFSYARGRKGLYNVNYIYKKQLSIVMKL